MKGIADVDMENKAVEIGTYFEKFVSEQVATGRFASGADVLQAGLRLLEEQQTAFLLHKSELEQNGAVPVGTLDESSQEATKVSQSVTEAMRALATAATSNEIATPVIPTTKGLLRSQIAAE